VFGTAPFFRSPPFVRSLKKKATRYDGVAFFLGSMMSYISIRIEVGRVDSQLEPGRVAQPAERVCE
jgi:hypothetical protein